jgi:repressor LexA
MTKKQARVLAFIVKYIKANGHPPTIPEIGKCLGVHLTGARQHLHLLEQKGYLRRVPFTHRGIVLL